MATPGGFQWPLSHPPLSIEGGIGSGEYSEMDGRMNAIRKLLDWMEDCTRVYESTDAGVPLVMPAPPCAELSARELFNAALVARELAWMLERAAVAGAGAGLDPSGELAQILRVKFEQHEADTPGAVFAQFVGAHAFEAPSITPGSSTQDGAAEGS